MHICLLTFNFEGCVGMQVIVIVTKSTQQLFDLSFRLTQLSFF